MMNSLLPTNRIPDNEQILNMPNSTPQTDAISKKLTKKQHTSQLQPFADQTQCSEFRFILFHFVSNCSIFVSFCSICVSLRSILFNFVPFLFHFISFLFHFVRFWFHLAQLQNRSAFVRLCSQASSLYLLSSREYT